MYAVAELGTQCWPHFQALGWPEGNVLLSPVQLLLRTNLLVPQHAHNPLGCACLGLLSFLLKALRSFQIASLGGNGMTILPLLLLFLVGFVSVLPG